MTRARKFWQEGRDHAIAPEAPEDRPRLLSPLVGPTTAEEMRAQLLEDPEYLEWMAEERAAELAAMTRRAYR